MIERSPQLRLGNLHLAVRARATRLLVWIAALCVPIYIASQFAPFLERETAIAKVLSSADYRDSENRAKESIEKPGDKKVILREFPINELTSVEVEITAEGKVTAEGASRVASPSSTKLKLRPDRVILWLGTVAVLLAVLTTLLPNLTQLRVGPLGINLGEQDEPRQPLA
jgi:hypothetical protein